MINSKDKELIDSWVALQYASPGSSDHEKNFWSHMRLDDLIDDDPNKALYIILYIIENNESEFVIANLAAGPLESLLMRHGELLIHDLKKYVKSNNKLKDALKLVWRNDISYPIWEEIKKISCF
jgi:hypothetical protein